VNGVGRREIGFEVWRREERMCLLKAVPGGSCRRARGESEGGRIRRGRDARRCCRDTWAARDLEPSRGRGRGLGLGLDLGGRRLCRVG